MKSDTELWNDEIDFPYDDRWQLIKNENTWKTYDSIMHRPIIRTAKYYEAFRDYFIAAQEVLNE